MFSFGTITKFGAGGNRITNSKSSFDNKYRPGAGGVGASTIANRRAKNRLATVCDQNKCDFFFRLSKN